MKKSVALIVCLALLMLISGLAFAGSEKPSAEKPSAEKPYEGLTLKMLAESGRCAGPGLVAKEVAEKELGIKIELTQVAMHELFTLIGKDWKTGGGAYDIVICTPKYNGDMMGGGYFIPLNDYMDKYNTWENYNKIIPQYRTLTCEWGDKVHAFPMDGDTSFMVYRKDILENSTHKANFKKKYGYELAYPNTYDQLLDIGHFFNGWDSDGDGKDEYGMQFFAWTSFIQETVFLPVFGAQGGILFDEDMNPLINSKAGVKALQRMKQLLEISPPGSLGMKPDENFASFVNGDVVIGLMYVDMGRLLYGKDLHWKGKIGYAQYPAEITETGEERRFCAVCFSRTLGISKFSKNKEAAFQVIDLLLKPENVIKIVVDPEGGMDPFSEVLMDLKVWEERGLMVDQEFLDIDLASFKYGYPEPMIPGVDEYYDIMRIEVNNYLAGQEKDPQVALDRIAETWREITQRRGKDVQKEYWEVSLDKAKAMGLTVPK